MFNTRIVLRGLPTVLLAVLSLPLIPLREFNFTRPDGAMILPLSWMLPALMEIR